MSDLIGSGLAFPMHADQRGGLALARGVEDVEQAIALILGTAPGERPMRPEFGCGIHALAFAPLDMRLIVSIEKEVSKALTRWEPRIDVQRVRTTLDPDAAGRVNISIGYVVRHTNDLRNLVFPFYTLGAG
jgi:hypothetical protein